MEKDLVSAAAFLQPSIMPVAPEQLAWPSRGGGILGEIPSCLQGLLWESVCLADHWQLGLCLFAAASPSLMFPSLAQSFAEAHWSDSIFFALDNSRMQLSACEALETSSTNC